MSCDLTAVELNERRFLLGRCRWEILGIPGDVYHHRPIGTCLRSMNVIAVEQKTHYSFCPPPSVKLCKHRSPGDESIQALNLRRGARATVFQSLTKKKIIIWGHYHNPLHVFAQDFLTLVQGVVVHDG